MNKSKGSSSFDDCDLTNANLTDASFVDSSFVGADFTGASLFNVDLRGSDLTATTWYKDDTNMIREALSVAIENGADLSFATMPDGSVYK